MAKPKALLSVSDKTGVLELAKSLQELGFELISTGGTAALLAGHNIPVTQVDDVTGFPECMDGRLKTLHPTVFGALLGVRDNPEHAKTMEEHAMPHIDVVAVNLYPFRKTVENPAHTLQQAIENIDIGGPSMIRAAAKNHKYVLIATDPSQYGQLIECIKSNSADETYRFKLAYEAIAHTAAYDAYISEYMRKIAAPEGFPPTMTITLDKHPTEMRYGENPHQEAAYYAWPQSPCHGIEKAELLHGKPLSFNNIADAHAALALAKEFTNECVCVAVKHATPCGVAVGASTLEAYTKAHDCDPQSIFGGIICTNQEIDQATAKEMHKVFLEIIIAPSFTPEALEVLTKRKNLRLLTLDIKPDHTTLECKSVGGGVLFQQSDSGQIESEEQKVVTTKAPTKTADLIFAMKVVKHVKSNAIVVAKDGVTLGLGGGEVSRVWAAEAALTRAGEAAKGAVLASDALFPFPDVVELCATRGITEIIQPGGSKKDQASIDAANQHGIAMVFTGMRHFKH
ncbi:MAG: bifunctional phosphoribosylaminoimidazolecarboxamide formyltransferase/IMP cyclohydrolase [Defluviitaleaceae bacterium]|nr:bifunctional phosphoribosylaminoimidazolecarboxamide formyltransferase/IMP cyclohydrolase [Defluviitaleaceae bacterium]